MKLILALASFGLVASSEVTPTEKVVQLLEGMAAKGKEEKHAEQVQFAAYKQFCDDTQVEKQRSIKESEELIAKLTADIQKATADAKRLGREIAAHEKDIATWEGDKKAATSVRETEKADYDAAYKNHDESIDAIKRAIEVLKKREGPTAQAAFLQVMPLLSKDQQEALNSFLQSGEPGVAHGYEFQSGGVVDMLEKLEDKFVTEINDMEKAEMNSKSAYDVLMQDLSGQIEQATKAKEEKSATKAKKLQAAADAKDDKVAETEVLEDDKKYLSELTATCEQKAAAFEQRQQLRADELAAIEKAVEILSSDDVAGAAKKHLPTMFIQLKSNNKITDSSNNNEAQWKALAFIKMRGSQLNSKILTQLAATAGADPFKKVKQLINDLIVRLMEEAAEEAEHKGWCDTELAANEATRKEKTSKVETLHAEIDQLTASIAKLTEELETLASEVADAKKALAEATELRNAEKSKNKATVEDAVAAQKAVAQALTVLQEFYAKAGEATSLIQQQPESPEIFDEPYKGMQSENGGVVGMLEVIQSDFARLESDTTADEEASQKEYDNFKTETDLNVATKEKDIEHKTMKKQNESQALEEKKSDKEGTQKELDAALSYFDKLKPTCINTGVSHEERAARREEEIQSLQEALEILSQN